MRYNSIIRLKVPGCTYFKVIDVNEVMNGWNSVISFGFSSSSSTFSTMAEPTGPRQFSGGNVSSNILGARIGTLLENGFYAGLPYATLACISAPCP
jgi:hypothetical protein